MEHSPTGDLRTAAEVAERLHVSKLVIERAARDGRIGSIKLGRTRLFTDDDVIDFLAAHRQQARR